MQLLSHFLVCILDANNVSHFIFIMAVIESLVNVTGGIIRNWQTKAQQTQAERFFLLDPCRSPRRNSAVGFAWAGY